MLKKRLTIAHYSENLDWLGLINKGIEIFIYHKKNTNLLYNEKKEINKNEFELCNTGRESHTYLKHIIDNYDNLSDIEFFCQGEPSEFPLFPHIVNEDIIPEYKQYSVFPKTFKSIKGKLTEHMINPDHIRDYGYPDTIDIWNNLFDYEPPKIVRIVPHALIKINKEKILMHDKKIYEKCLDYFLDGNKNNLYAWSFEYFWALLFDNIHIKK
jgi:hypothetical protein